MGSLGFVILRSFWTSGIDYSYQFDHKRQCAPYKVDLAILRKTDISSIFLSKKICNELFVYPCTLS